SSPRSRLRTSASLAIDDAGFGRLDLQREVFRVDPALCKAAGDEPKSRLRRALEHVAQLLALAEPPDRADAGGNVGAEQSCDEGLLAFPPGGEHHQVGLFQQLLELIELREADPAFGDEVGAADVEVVAAAAGEVQELPAGPVLAVAEPEALLLEPIEEFLVELLRVLRGKLVCLPRQCQGNGGGDEVAVLERRTFAVERVDELRARVAVCDQGGTALDDRDLRAGGVEVLRDVVAAVSGADDDCALAFPGLTILV